MFIVLLYLSLSAAAHVHGNEEEFHRRHYDEEVEDDTMQAAETRHGFQGFGGIGRGIGGYSSGGGEIGLGLGGHSLGEYGGRSFTGGSFGSPAGNIVPFHHRGYSGGEFDTNSYSKGQKDFNDRNYEKAFGQKHKEASHGGSGATQENQLAKSNKGDAAHYSDHQGGKKVLEDGKFYKGNEYFNKEGKNSDQKKQNSGHKKGHVVKGFKSSHHKDENEHSEQYYDEASDEGDAKKVHEQGKKYGTDSQKAYKGGHDDGRFVAGSSKKQGEYDSSLFSKKGGGADEKYDRQNYIGKEQLYGSKGGKDLESLRGHHESSAIFKKHPYHY